MANNFAALSVVILYMALLIGFSFFAQYRQKKKAQVGDGDSYLFAGKSMGTVLVCVTIIGMALGANGTVGIAQNGFLFGISAGWYDGAFAVCIILAAIFLIKKIRSMNLNTISQLFGDYYGMSSRLTASAGQIMVGFFIMVAQHIAGGAILSALLPEFFSMTNGMILSAAIFLAIALIGGMGSTAVTNIVNIVLLYLAVAVAVFFAIKGGGGFSNIINSLPDPVYTHPINGLGLGLFVSYFIVFFTSTPTLQCNLQMVFSAKDDKAAFRGYLLGGIIVLPFGFATAFIGMYAAVILPGLENSAMALPAVVMTFPGIVAGIVLAGMWAADVSTATTLIMSNSALFVNDIIRPLRKNPLSGKQEVLCSKVLAVLFTLFSLYCAFFVTYLLKFITMGLSLGVAFFVIMMVTLYFPKACKASSSLFTTVAAFLVFVAWWAFPSLGNVFPHIAYLQLIVCPTVFLLTVLLDKRPAFFRTDGFEKLYGKKAITIRPY